VGLFGGIGKVLGKAAKVVTKPVSIVVNPLAKAAKSAAKSATKGTPLESAVNNITKINFAKNPIKGIGQAVIENYKGAAQLGKSLVAAKIGGAVQGAVGNAMKGTPLEGTTAATAIQSEVSDFTNKLTGSDVLKTGAKSTRVAGGGDVKPDSALKSGGNPFGMNLARATDPSWASFAARPDTLGGVFGGTD